LIRILSGSSQRRERAAMDYGIHFPNTAGQKPSQLTVQQTVGSKTESIA
jgi:hypothetical protein